MSRLLERSRYEPKSHPVKPPTRFVANLLKKSAITAQEAELLSILASPHLQFEAVKRYRADPEKGLAAHVQAVKAANDSAELERGNVLGGSADSARSIFRWIWEVIAQQPLSPWARWLLAGACAAFVFGLLARTVEPWVARSLNQSHPVQMPAMPAPVATAPTASAPAPVPTPPARATRPAPRVPGPQNFSARPTNNQMMQLNWDSLGENMRYHLYSASAADMESAQLEDEAAIPVNWYNWMPPADGPAVWLAVKGVLPNGQETQFSNSVRIDIPQPATSATAAPAPQKP